MLRSTLVKGTASANFQLIGYNYGARTSYPVHRIEIRNSAIICQKTGYVLNGPLPAEIVKVLAFATHGLVADQLTGLSEPALVLTPPRKGTALDDGLRTPTISMCGILQERHGQCPRSGMGLV